MMFLDLDNFRKSLFINDKKRFYDIGKFQYFIIKFLNNKLNFLSCNEESLIRTYAYTGEYSSNIIKKLRDKKIDEKIIENHENRMRAQKSFFEIIKNFNFFELKTLPLKYENEKIFQKGIDVKMAIDLVFHAFNNNFDTAIICSGDIDLIEAVRMVKNLGKKVIIVSHPRMASNELTKEADFFINIKKLNERELNQFSNLKTNSK